MNRFKQYNIGSKVVRVIFSNGPASKVLQKELSLYQIVDRNQPPDMIIRINPITQYQAISQNPFPHRELENGFVASFNKIDIAWLKEDVITVDILFDEYRRNFVEKWNNIQFNYLFERIGHIFHELVLIPSLLILSNDVTVIHASSVANPDGKGYLFSGTGGCGKTAISTSLILNHDYQFIADDFSILSREGCLLGNFAFPKIYAYNVENNPILKSILMGKRSFADRSQWNLKLHIPPYTVRRSVNPKDFYSGRICFSTSLERIFFLYRCVCKEVYADELSYERAVRISKAILLSEQMFFFNHLYWHSYNRIAAGQKPIFDYNAILYRYEKNLKRIFSEQKIILLKIPLNKKIECVEDLGILNLT